MGKTTRAKIQNIHQALIAATASINLAKRLLSELEGPSSRELPGEFGVFDGRFAVMEGGEKYPVPENYASKSKLVCGDKLKRFVLDGEERFKQVARVKREDVVGVLAKKDGKWHVVTSHGSYEVLASAVSYWEGKEGDEAVVIIPQEDKRVAFGALKEIVKDSVPGGAGRKGAKGVVSEEKKDTLKEEPVVKEPEIKKKEGKGAEEKKSKPEEGKASSEDILR